MVGLRFFTLTAVVILLQETLTIPIHHPKKSNGHRGPKLSTEVSVLNHPLEKESGQNTHV